MSAIHAVPSSQAVTLGILAGGRATRLGGCDKAWLERAGKPLVLGLAQDFAQHVDAILVSANRNQERYLAHGLRAIHDRVDGIGPLGGLEALATACRSAWLLTLPVDVLHASSDLIEALSLSETGAFVEDDDGVQPLVALWHVETLREAATTAIDAGDLAVHALQSRLGMARVRLDGVRVGNLNTPEDLVAAGIDVP